MLYVNYRASILNDGAHVQRGRERTQGQGRPRFCQHNVYNESMSAEHRKTAVCVCVFDQLCVWEGSRETGTCIYRYMKSIEIHETPYNA